MNFSCPVGSAVVNSIMLVAHEDTECVKGKEDRQTMMMV